MRKCLHCKQRLPALKECKTPYQEGGFCGGFCYAGHQKQKAEKRQKEASKPRTARVSAKRKPRKPRAGDDRAYLQWVKTQPCALCGMPADDAHHIIGMGFGGMGMTAPDLLTIPVCRADHGRIHADPELWQRQPLWVLRTQAKAIQEGVL